MSLPKGYVPESTALSTTVLIAVTIKSAYLPISCVDLAWELMFSAVSRVDSNVFLFSLYLLGLLCMFL